MNNIPAEQYPCYVKVCASFDSTELVEIPTERDGSLRLATVAAQYPKAIGLRCKTETGSWRGVRLNEDNVIFPPYGGWHDTVFYVVRAKRAVKRKAVEAEGPLEKLSRMTEEEILTDLIVLGLPYSANEDDVKEHFGKYGELDLCEIKYDSDKKSRGFGFVRYKTVDAVRQALEASHVLHNRTVEIRFPKEDAKQDSVPTKLFIGRLPRGTTVEELRDHFLEYGSIKDVYIPAPFRGFGFVTFDSPSVADEVMNATHVIKGTYVNVSQPSTKKQKSEEKGPVHGNMGGGNMRGPMGGHMQGGNMQGGNMNGGNMQGNMQGNMNMQGGPQPLFGGYGSYYGNGNNNFWGNNKTPSGNFGWNKT